MVGTFTRRAVFLRWDGDATTRAFLVTQPEYRGATQKKLASYARSAADNSLLATRASTRPRAWVGQLVAMTTALAAVYGTANDGSDDFAYGDIAELEDAHEATDLKCLSFEDSDYWTAEWMGDWDEVMEFDPKRNYAIVLCTLEGKV